MTFPRLIILVLTCFACCSSLSAQDKKQHAAAGIPGRVQRQGPHRLERVAAEIDRERQKEIVAGVCRDDDARATEARRPVSWPRRRSGATSRLREHWKVEDGVIVFDGKGESLCTDKDYGNFELYVDWKIKEKGDSGIYLRGTPQIQIWDPFTSPDTKTGEDKGSGGVFNNQKNPKEPPPWPISRSASGTRFGSRWSATK